MRSITIRDVAKRAGVSASTVSRVLNHTTGVRETTRKQVEEAIRAMGYSPNHLARSLSRGYTRTVGVVLPDISNPFFPVLARGISDVASCQGYTVILCNSDGDATQEEASVMTLLERHVDGIIFVAGHENSSAFIRRACATVPVVTVDREIEGLPCDTVTVDNFKGTYEVTRHLLQIGHVRVAFITGPLYLSTARKRLEGFRQALKDAGIYDDPPILHGDFKYDTGYSLARELIRLKCGATAVIASNDLMAIGVVRCLQNAGFSVPDDVAVAGFDDIFVASMIQPALTTVAQPAYRMGALAAEMLLRRISGDAGAEPASVVLEPVLVVRESTQGKVGPS